MRRRITVSGLAALLVAVLAGGTAVARELTLNAVQYPERRDVDVEFVRTAEAPRGGLVRANVEFREGVARVELEFGGMRPAVLFGGDVTCFVVWAVTREGDAANLGELWVREARGEGEYSTGLKEFALLITAESYPLVSRPSELVMFYSQAVEEERARNTPFAFAAFTAAPSRERESLADAVAEKDALPDLEQARKAMELARREGAESYAPELMREAGITLAQATNLATVSTRRKGMIDYSRRTVALASEAIRTTLRKKEAERLEQLIATRRAEMDAVEARAAAAEAAAARAEEQRRALEAAVVQVEAQKATVEAAAEAARAAQLRSQAELSTAKVAVENLRRERATLEAEMTRLEADKRSLAEAMAALQAEQETLRTEKARLAEEKDALAARLEGALSQVASTQTSGRGYIVNLPDILFDVNEATLKHGARVTLAKLAGILLMMPQLNLRIEGHTDSTGGAAYNLRLSQRRADSVLDFLAEQGIAATRMTAAGYGFERPIADNDTAAGRARNRRVEVIIAEGEVREAAP